MFRTDDTIAAISSAAGAGELAIVRLSGADALWLAAEVFTPHEGQLDGGGFRRLRGMVRLSSGSGKDNNDGSNNRKNENNKDHGRDARGTHGRDAHATNGGVELPAVAYVFRAPRSYTRQDICELHVPGSPAVATWLLDDLLGRGARQAMPGEFTARAFFSGRIDLSAAEGVADIIEAASGAQLRSGLSALGGRIHRFCSEASDSLAETLSAVEASIDLADENIELDSPKDLASRMAELSVRLADFAARAADMPEDARQLRIAIAGEPNAGKSSLLNALALSERAIVSDIAGTTRDVLRAEAQIEGQLVLLEDCAGLQEASDSLSAAGQQAAKGAITSADAILFVIDVALRELQRQVDLLRDVQRLNAQAPLVLLANKTDLLHEPPGIVAIADLEKLSGLKPLGISAATGAGLSELRRNLARLLRLEAPRSADAMGLHLRQKACLRSAAEASGRASELLSSAASVSDVAELAAVELRASLAALGQISGQVATEDILGRIFRRFCVGK